jgi:hypothetical protein
MIGVALKPLVRLALTFAIVWFYNGLTAAYLSGYAQLFAVIALSVPTWILVGRLLFPKEGDGLLANPFDRGRE